MDMIGGLMGGIGAALFLCLAVLFFLLALPFWLLQKLARKGSKLYGAIEVIGGIIALLAVLFFLVFVAMDGDDGDAGLDFFFGVAPAAIAALFYWSVRQDFGKELSTFRGLLENEKTVELIRESLDRQKRQQRQAAALKQRISLLEAELGGPNTISANGNGRAVV